VVPDYELGDDWKGLKHKFRRIRLRKPYMAGTEEARRIIEERLLLASKNIRFSFVHSEAETNGMNAGRFTYGVQYQEEIAFSTLLFSSLLDQTLTTGERASGVYSYHSSRLDSLEFSSCFVATSSNFRNYSLDTFRFAVTLAHETAVSQALRQKSR